MQLVLHGYWRSSCTWRVRTALHWKGLPFETVPVHLLRDGGEQRMAAHRARNPAAQVPVLEVDGDPISQSMAILRLIEDLAPTPPLLPADPIARAHAVELAELINAGIQPLQNLSVLAAVDALAAAAPGDVSARKAWAQRFIGEGLAAAEVLVQRHGAGFCVGDALSWADLALVPQLYNARRFGLGLDHLPALLAVEARCAALPAFVAAHPDAQPDAQLEPSHG